MTRNEGRPSQDGWPAYRLLAAFLLMVVLLSGAAIVFLPIGWQLNRFVVWLYYFIAGQLGGSPLSLLGYDLLLNMALFAVPVFLAAIVWPRVRIWQWTLLGFVASIGVEAIQFLHLPRDATIVDVIANTAGSFVGACLGMLLSPKNDTRSRRFRLAPEPRENRGPY